MTPLPNQRVYDFPANTDRLISRNRGVQDVWVAGQPIRRHGVEVPGGHARFAGQRLSRQAGS